VPPRRVAVGVVRRPFGLRGAVFVHPDPDVPEDFAPGTVFATARGPLTVAETLDHRGMRVVTFAGVGDRDAAAGLRDLVLERDASADDLDTDDAEAYWTDQVVGLPVTDPAGARLGTVDGLLDGTAHDYLAVRTPDGREVLVPAVAALVEVARDRVVVQPLPGLFDDAAEDAGRAGA